MKENTGNKFLLLYIVFALFSTASVVAFADESLSSFDDNPSLNTTDVSATPSEKMAREYYEKGVALANEGKLDEARDYFEKAIRITEHSETAEHIKEIKIQDQGKKDESARTEDIEAAYKQAVDLYKQKKYHPAQDAFEHLDTIAPNYRATDSYLKIIGQDISTSDALAAQQQAAEAQYLQQEDEAARIKEKEMSRQQMEEKERKEQINKQAEEVYNEAVRLYKNKEFAEAKKKFAEVNLVVPDYKSTMEYLGLIDRGVQEEQQKALEEQRWKEDEERKKQEAEHQAEAEAKELQHKIDIQERAQSLYTAAVALFDGKNMDGSLEKFNAIEVLSPDFKATRSYIARIEQWRDDQQKLLLKVQTEEQQKVLQEQRWEQEVALRKKQEAERQAEAEAKELQHQTDIKEHVQSLYTTAVALFDRKNMQEALERFNDIEALSPDFKATRSYILRIDQWKADQQKLLLETQKEAEAARTKENEIQHQQMEEKERKDKINKQAEEVYEQAVQLYKNREFVEAKEKFEETNLVIPGYQSTQYYLNRIDGKIKEAQAADLRQKESAVERQREQELKDKTDQVEKIYVQALSLYRDHQYDSAKDEFLKVNGEISGFKSTQYYLNKIDDKIKEAQASALRQKELAVERQRAQELKDKADQAEKIYEQALNLYRDHQWEEARTQFESVEEMSPDFKHTRRYLQKIESFMAEASKPKSVVVPPPVPPVVPQPPVEVTPKPAQSIMPAPIKVAVSLEDQQKQAQDIAALAEKSAQLYQQVADIADDSATVQTKRKMAEVNGILNNLKDNKERLLRQMREEQFKRQEDEAKAKQEEHRVEAEKMYQDAVEYLRSHEYAKAKIKFIELESIIPDYKATRRYLTRIEEDLKRAGVTAVTVYEKNQAEHLKQMQDKENTEELRRVQAEQEKQRITEQQQQASLNGLAQKASDINDDIIRLSKAQDYEAMKVKFEELENTVTALTALKDTIAKQKGNQEREIQLTREAIDHRNEMIRAQRQEDRQIHAYDTVQPFKEYRPVLSNQPSDVDYFKRREVVQEQNTLFSEGVDRYEHKKYTEARLLFGELADQHDRRAEAWLKKVDRAITQELLRSQEGEARERTAFIADQLKAQRELIVIQERERQRQKKLTEELERQKRLYEDDQLLQLRKEEMMKAQELERERQEAKRLKLEKTSEKQQETLRFHKIGSVPQPAAKPAVGPVAVIPSQAKIDTGAEAREKIKEAKQKEKEHQEELKAEQIKAQAEKSAQEKKHREELLRQQDQERQEKIKQEEILREQAQHRQEMESQERQHQAQLEAQRETVRKELEDGVEAMYQKALSLYKQGDYTAAADRFKDVQDIFPGYKRAGQYMDEARQKALNASTPPAEVPSSPSVSHQEDVSKALDLFDPDAK